MLRPNRRIFFLTVALVLFFPLYGCMVIAPVSLLTLSMISTKVPATWWLIFINPMIVVGVFFNYLLASFLDFAFIRRLGSEKARMTAALVIIAAVAAAPFIFKIYGWAGPTGAGEWARFPEFFQKAVR